MQNELIALSEIATARGLKREDIEAEIKKIITSSFRNRYPEDRREIVVEVDERTWDIRILFENRDVTPADFAPLAYSIAKQILNLKLSSIHDEKQSKTLQTVFQWIVGIIFWMYNGAFLVLAFVFVLGLFNSGFRNGFIQTITTLGIYRNFLLLVMGAVPFLTIFYYLKKKIYKNPVLELKLFFIFEVSSIILTLILLSIIEQPASSVFLFLVIILSVPAVLYFAPSRGNRSGLSKVFQTVIYQLMSLAFLYLSILVSFAVPLFFGAIFSIVGEIFRNIGQIQVYEIIGAIFILFFGSIGLIFISALIASPYILCYVFGRRFITAKGVLSDELGVKLGGEILILSGIFFILIFAIASWQPDYAKYLTKMGEIRTIGTFENKEKTAREILRQEKKYKKIVEDMYFANKHYFWTGDDDFLKEGYEDILKLDSATAASIQDYFFVLAYPFVYRGEYSSSALESYKSLFGKYPYDKKGDEEPQGRVKVVNREIDAKTDHNGLLATISVTEEYITTDDSWRSEEVIYEFSLPSDATIYDLLLGPRLEYQGIIAPVGAARQTYEREVNRGRDPALLEQTGPRQYRLRVFPIPGKNDKSILIGLNQKVKFTYVTSLTKDGFALPVFSRKLNIKEVNNSTYYLDGEKIEVDGSERYIPWGDKAGAFDLCQLSGEVEDRVFASTSSAVLIPLAETPGMQNTFTCQKGKGYTLTSSAQNLKIAVVYDVSYANRDNQFPRQLSELLQKNPGFARNNDIKFYKFNEQLSKPVATLENLVYFGRSDPFKLINLVDLKTDIIILVSSKEAVVSPTYDFIFNAPVYMIFREGIIPPFDKNITVLLTRQGGGIVDSFEEAINSFVISRNFINDSDFTPIQVGPYWATGIKNYQPVDMGDILYNDKTDPLSRIVNRASMNFTIRKNKNIPLADLAFADKMNAFSEKTNIISPYSSLIALVNSAQLAELKRNKESVGRYDDEFSGRRVPTSIPPPANLRSSGIGDLFGAGLLGTRMHSLSMPAAMDGGGGGVAGDIGGVLISLFIFLNVIFIGGGVFIFGIIFIKRRFHKR